MLILLLSVGVVLCSPLSFATPGNEYKNNGGDFYPPQLSIHPFSSLGQMQGSISGSLAPPSALHLVESTEDVWTNNGQPSEDPELVVSLVEDHTDNGNTNPTEILETSGKDVRQIQTVKPYFESTDRNPDAKFHHPQIQKEGVLHSTKHAYVASVVGSVTIKPTKNIHRNGFVPPMVFAQQHPEINLEPTEVEVPGTTPTTIAMVTESIAFITDTFFQSPLNNKAILLATEPNESNPDRSLLDNGSENKEVSLVNTTSQTSRVNTSSGHKQENYHISSGAYNRNIKVTETNRNIKALPVSLFINNTNETDYKRVSQDVTQEERLPNEELPQQDDPKIYLQDNLDSSSDTKSVNKILAKNKNLNLKSILSTSGRNTQDIKDDERNNTKSLNENNGTISSSKGFSNKEIKNIGEMSDETLVKGTKNYFSPKNYSLQITSQTENDESTKIVMLVSPNPIAANCSIDKNNHSQESQNPITNGHESTLSARDIIDIESTKEENNDTFITEDDFSVIGREKNIETRAADDESYFRTLELVVPRESRVFFERPSDEDRLGETPTSLVKPKNIEDTNDEKLKVGVITSSSELDFKQYVPESNASLFSASNNDSKISKSPPNFETVHKMKTEPSPSTSNNTTDSPLSQFHKQTHFKDSTSERAQERMDHEDVLSQVQTKIIDGVEVAISAVDGDQIVTPDNHPSIKDPVVTFLPSQTSVIEPLRINLSSSSLAEVTLPSSHHRIKSDHNANSPSIPKVLKIDTSGPAPLVVYPQQPSNTPLQQQERNSVSVSEHVNRSLAPGCVAAIVIGVLLSIIVIAGAFAFVVYNRQTGIRPKVLSSDRSCANSDSGGYLDDQCRVAYVNSQIDLPKSTPEDLVSLDNDSFLNSLESMTIQNLWTDSIRHTKL